MVRFHRPSRWLLPLSSIIALAAAGLVLAAAVARKSFHPGRTGAGTHVARHIISPLGARLTLKFHDEFNGVRDRAGGLYINRRKWRTTFWQGSSQRTLTGNGEAEYYMGRHYGGLHNIPINQRPNPFSFQHPGILTISAFPVPKKLWKNYWMGSQRHFASGLLISDPAFTFKYGYVVGRFKLPADRGAWPAFWLLCDAPSLGSADRAHRWPPEVDIFEFFGHRPTKFSGGMIGRKGEKPGFHFGYHKPGFDISKGFHTWGFQWNAHQAVWTFDGKIWARGTVPPSLRHHFYILINMAVGGNWYSQEMKARGTPYKPWQVDQAAMPWKMQCDYVRVYQ